jgi:hypothetical protein
MGALFLLDEIDEGRLVYELERRRLLRSQGRCDYCERACGIEPPCKFPRRHQGKLWPEDEDNGKNR